MIDSIIPIVQQQGPLAAFMLTVIYWQYNANKSLFRAVETVQDERFKAMEAHITKLEKKADKCESDRLELWSKIASLNKE